eukprot:GHVU01059762.1.p1 GENE.GHVU01059762.1~~GHVU01059762.1.p1  ORF type:complete len:269 (+),score=49.77 GHVU01059762.1:2-808(+)
MVSHSEHLYGHLRQAKLFAAQAQSLRNSIKHSDFVKVDVVVCECAKCVETPMSESDKESAAWIATWFNEMIELHRSGKMPFRPKQLWIHGPPNIGKSTLIEALEECLRVYKVPKTEDFYDFYADREWDLSILDEFHGQKTITWLNEWLDGSKIVLRVKGAQTLKTDRLATLIVSNPSPEQCYRKAIENYADALAPLVGEDGRCKLIAVNRSIMHSIKVVSRPRKRPANLTVDELEDHDSDSDSSSTEPAFLKMEMGGQMEDEIDLCEE